MAGRVNNLFNSFDIDRRASIINQYGQYLDCVFEPGYFYHFYALGSSIILCQYSVDQDRTVDIWLIEYGQIDYFIKDVNIDDIWERVRR